MKNSIVGMLLALIILVSCQSKTQKDAETSSDKSISEVKQVGIDKKGIYVVTHSQEIKEQWEKHLADKGKHFDLNNFTITKGVTTGDSLQTYYMLSATNAGNTVKAAALLNLKNNTFYFETHPDSKAYNLVICEGKCNEGCDPIVTQSDGMRFLICSSCTDCRKHDMEIR